MAVYSFSLRFTPSSAFIFLRELNGHDELMADETGTPGILKLLNGIIVPANGIGKAVNINAEKIAVTDRDHLLSGIYKFTYGDKIESNLSCPACTTRYDISFSLTDLETHYNNNAIPATMDTDGFFETDQVRFRLPTGEDELAAWGMPAEKAAQLLLQRCVPAPVSTEMSGSIQQSMEEVAPVLLTEMNASCPECGRAQQVEFDIQSFLVNRLRYERKRVIAEVHCLASAYGWAHKEILDLPRSLRKSYAQFAGLN